MIEKGKLISGRYEIIKNIGEGGMANVYVGYDKILNRKVAIKILRGDLASDEKFVRRFQREALSASSLSHPNIVEMYDVGEDDGIYYIIMEYIEGKTLKQLIKKRGSITLSEAIDIMLQLTDGIAHAHDSYIIHRDLKPQNIMIKEDGSVKITDFGIAVALNSTQLTQTNSVMGSVHYLPPEQASGKGSTIRSDIYSMGILFYELITGSLPFKGDNAVEIALKQMHDPIPSVRRKDSSIPQSVENVILKSSAKNPKNRYTDAKEMHADLLTVLNEERLDEARFIYPYPEHEKDDSRVKEEKTKKVEKEAPTKEVIESKIKEEKPIAKKIDNEEDKIVRGTNKIILFLFGLISLIVIFALVAILILPSLTKIPDVKIPDVAGLSVIEAEEKLKDAGFEVALNVEKEENVDVEKGKVIKTNPDIGRKIKKGSTITLYESLGKEVYVMENFVKENYIEIQTILENVHKLKVKVEKKNIEDLTDVGEQDIVEQSPQEGTKLSEGDEVILYIPNIMNTYPDIVGDGWTVDDVKGFCDKYGINLKINYETTEEYSDGMIISQSRDTKTPIVKGTTLVITVAVLPETSIEDSGMPSDGETP